MSNPSAVPSDSSKPVFSPPSKTKIIFNHLYDRFALYFPVLETLADLICSSDYFQEPERSGIPEILRMYVNEQKRIFDGFLFPSNHCGAGRECSN